LKYITEDIRRQDRLLDETRAIEILKSAEYGVLSLSDEDGQPYGIPVNYVWDGDNKIYIHCAPEGKKLRILEKNNKISFCVVGRTNLLPSKFTTEYESIILSGSASTGLSDDEKHHALSLLIDKLSPNDKVIGEKYAEKSFHRVDIIRLDIEQWSGKSKKIKGMV